MLRQQNEMPSDLASVDNPNNSAKPLRVVLAANVEQLSDPHLKALLVTKDEQSPVLLQTSSSSPPSSLKQAESAPQHFAEWLSLGNSTVRPSTGLQRKHSSATSSPTDAPTSSLSREPSAGPPPQLPAAPRLNVGTNNTHQQLPPLERDGLLLSSFSAPVQLSGLQPTSSFQVHGQHLGATFNQTAALLSQPIPGSQGTAVPCMPVSGEVQANSDRPAARFRWAPQDATAARSTAAADNGPFSHSSAAEAAKAAVELGPFGSASSAAAAAAAAALAEDIGHGSLLTQTSSGVTPLLRPSVSFVPDGSHTPELWPSEKLHLADSAELSRSLRALQLQLSRSGEVVVAAAPGAGPFANPSVFEVAGHRIASAIDSNAARQAARPPSPPAEGMGTITACIAHLEQQQANLKQQIAALKRAIPTYGPSAQQTGSLLQECQSAPLSGALNQSAMVREQPSSSYPLQQTPITMEHSINDTGMLQERRSCPPALTELHAAQSYTPMESPTASQGIHAQLDDNCRNSAEVATPKSATRASTPECVQQAVEGTGTQQRQRGSSPAPPPRHASGTPSPRRLSRSPQRDVFQQQQQHVHLPGLLQTSHSAPHTLQQVSVDDPAASKQMPYVAIALPLATEDTAISYADDGKPPVQRFIVLQPQQMPEGRPSTGIAREPYAIPHPSMQTWRTAGNPLGRHLLPLGNASMLQPPQLLVVQQPGEQEGPTPMLQFNGSSGGMLHMWHPGTASPAMQVMSHGAKPVAMETDSKVFVPIRTPQPRLEDAVDLLPKQAKRASISDKDHMIGLQHKRRRSFANRPPDESDDMHAPLREHRSVPLDGEVPLRDMSASFANQAVPASEPQVLLHIEAPAHWDRHEPSKADAVKLVRLDLPDGGFFPPEQLLETVPDEALQEVAARTGGVVALNDVVAALRLCGMQPDNALNLLQACLAKGHMAQQLWDERVRGEQSIRQAVVNQEVEVVLSSCEWGGMQRDHIYAVFRVQNACMMAAYQLQCRSLKSGSEAAHMQEAWMWLGADKPTIHAMASHGFGQQPNGCDPQVFWSPHAHQSAAFSVSQDAAAAAGGEPVAGASSRHALLMCCTALVPSTTDGKGDVPQMCIAALYPAYIVVFSE